MGFALVGYSTDTYSRNILRLPDGTRILQMWKCVAFSSVLLDVCRLDPRAGPRFLCSEESLRNISPGHAPAMSSTIHDQQDPFRKNIFKSAWPRSHLRSCFRDRFCWSLLVLREEPSWRDLSLWPCILSWFLVADLRLLGLSHVPGSALEMADRAVHGAGACRHWLYSFQVAVFATGAAGGVVRRSDVDHIRRVATLLSYLRHTRPPVEEAE